MTANQKLTNTIRHSQQEANNDLAAKQAMGRLVHRPQMRPRQLLQVGQTPTTISSVVNKLKVVITIRLMEAYTVLKAGTMVPLGVTVIESFWCQFKANQGDQAGVTARI
jgi:hypothetical protein